MSIPRHTPDGCWCGQRDEDLHDYAERVVRAAASRMAALETATEGDPLMFFAVLAQMAEWCRQLMVNGEWTEAEAEQFAQNAATLVHSVGMRFAFSENPEDEGRIGLTAQNVFGGKSGGSA